MPLIPELWRPRVKGHKFKARVKYVVRYCLKMLYTFICCTKIDAVNITIVQ